MKSNKFQEYVDKIINYPVQVGNKDSLFYLNNLVNSIEISDILTEEKSQMDFYKFLNSELKFMNKYKNLWSTNKIEKEDIRKGAQVLNTGKHFITEAIQNGCLEDAIKGTVILSYFKRPFNQLIIIEKFSETKIEILLRKLIKLLANYAIEVKFSEEIAYTEQRYYEEYKQGVTEKNIQKVYSFIQALDRGIGYQPNGIIRELIKLTFFLNPREFNKLINQKNDPLEIAMMIEPLENFEKLTLGLEKTSENEWVLLGITYQVLNKNREKLHVEMQINQMTTILERLKHLNDDMFFQSINFFENNLIFNIILGRVLGSSNKTKIFRYVNTYKISKHRSSENQDKLFVQNFYEKSGKEKTLFLCNQMFLRWNEYLKTAVKSEEYFNDIIYTNCFYFIVYYYVLRDNNQKSDKVHIIV